MAETEVIQVELQDEIGITRKNYKSLSPKQEKFCECLVMGMTQVAAYKMAYNTTSLKDDNLGSAACALAADYRIVARVAALRLPAQEEFQKHRKAWLFELMAMAFVDPGDFFDGHGNPIEIPQLPPAARKMLAGFDIVEEFSGKGDTKQSVGYVRKFKMLSKLEALKLFGEALQWFPSQAGGKLGARVEIKDKDRSIKIELVKAGD